MLRSLFSTVMILLAAPACAESRLVNGFPSGGFHGGGFRVFHHRRHAHRFFFGGYLCGYNCGWGFDSEVYDYGDGNGYGYGDAYSYGHSYSNGYADGYRAPVTRGEISKLAGREISRDVIGALKRHGLIDGAIRAPQPGAPFAYVTTRKFLEAFGLASLRDLPDLERLKTESLMPTGQSEDDLDSALGLLEEKQDAMEENDAPSR